MQEIKQSDPQVITEAVKVLKTGGLIIYPTETCYGVGVDATSQAAVDKLLQYKQRPSGKAISIAVSDHDMASKYVKLNPEAEHIYTEFLPGPVTVISQSRNQVAQGLAAENNTLGIRIPDYVLIRDIVREFGKPITATSANLAGDKTPYSIADILENMSAKRRKLVDLIIDAGELPKNPPSLVIDTTLENSVVYRRGRVELQNSRQVNTYNVTETEEVGASLITEFKGILAVNTLFIMLNGSLGSGKTHFTKGIGRELGIREVITSPSYVYMQEYEQSYSGQKAKLIHLDPWRITELSDFLALQPQTWFAPGNVVVIEWANRFSTEIERYLKEQNKVTVVEIDIEYMQEPDQRLITIHY